MAQKPGIPKGTRDFTPEQTAKRNYIFDTLKTVFNKYAYSSLETPAMENLSTLMGKYGEEGDKLLFKILNSGDYASKVDLSVSENRNSLKLTSQISEKGLRYDLTVPFARYVVQHRNEISFPFKRWQIQPVWRADKPQKGRYREFFQCDVDVVGSNSLYNEVELVQIIDEGFKALNVNVLIKLNNRKILSGIAEIINETDRIIDITVAIDKLEKIGLEKVNQELLNKGIAQEKIDQLQPIIQLKGTNTEKLDKLQEVLAVSETGLKGVEEIRFVLENISKLNVATEIELDLTLARGLNYYTGAIFEVKAKDYAIGSICGGGRYDDLTSIFGLKDVSGVGVSFGADRIYDVMDGLDLFPEETGNGPKLLFLHFGATEQAFCLPLLASVRNAGIKAEMYPDLAKMNKQMKYANNRKVAFVAVVGSNELEQNSVMLKNMETGEQELVSAEDLVAKLA